MIHFAALSVNANARRRRNVWAIGGEMGRLSIRRLRRCGLSTMWNMDVPRVVRRDGDDDEDEEDWLE